MIMRIVTKHHSEETANMLLSLASQPASVERDPLEAFKPRLLNSRLSPTRIIP
jgi:hypothetical protein